MTDLYIVRVLLIRRKSFEPPVVMIQNSTEYKDEQSATALFKDLLREMPQQEVKR